MGNFDIDTELTMHEYIFACLIYDQLIGTSDDSGDLK